MDGKQKYKSWTLEINHPVEIGFDHNTIVEILTNLLIDYYCLSDEIAPTGTMHTHIYIFRASKIRFRTLKDKFPTAHIERAEGSAQENRDYILKEGKWKNTPKAETSVPGSFLEYGKMPTQKEERVPKMMELFGCIKAGMTNAEIINEYPEYAFRVKDIDIVRQTLLTEKCAFENRELTVTYIFGESNTGKTRMIYELYGAKNIHRVTNYKGGKGLTFDGYVIQDVLVFEDFNGQIGIGEMLHYLDIYPLNLPARYTDKVACYTKVYIISDIPLEQQYPWVQLNRADAWRAFERRIHNIIHFLPDGKAVEVKKDGVYIDKE